MPSADEWQRIVRRTHRWHIRSADQMGAPVVDEPRRCLCGMRQAATDGRTGRRRSEDIVRVCSAERRVSTLLTLGGVGRALLSRTRPVEHRRLRQRHSTAASPLGQRPSAIITTTSTPDSTPICRQNLRPDQQLRPAHPSSLHPLLADHVSRIEQFARSPPPRPPPTTTDLTSSHAVFVDRREL